jgi:hypothetical protein
MHDYLIDANDAAIYLKETGVGDYSNVKETIPADEAFQPLPRRRATPSSTDLHMARLAIGPIKARQGLAPALIAA